MQLPVISLKRQCDGCDMCCAGWLTGDIYGHKMWPGRPCHYNKNGGCAIYKNRPIDPCRTFECAWITDKSIPEWMKPNEIHVVMVPKEINGHKFLQVSECGQQLDSRVLSWLFMQHITGKIQNFRYQLCGGWNYVGSAEFCAEMDKLNKLSEI